MSAFSIIETEVLEQPALALVHPSGAEATVLLYGGHLVSFRTAGGDELLYLSPRATTAGGKAVRGGVPVIFPSFDQRGPGPLVPRHGFARTRVFARGEDSPDGVELLLQDDEETRQWFPHGFGLRLRVKLAADGVTLGVEIENRGPETMAWTGALHTYLRVEDLEQATVRGLQGLHYEDKVRDGARAEEALARLSIQGEVDRIYGGVSSLVLQDGQRQIEVTQRGFVDGVVWNPGPVLAGAMGDLPDEGYRHMVCLEAACALEPVQLAPSETFKGEQRIALVSAGAK